MEFEKPRGIEIDDQELAEYCGRKMEIPGYICLAIPPGEERYVGLVEYSFFTGYVCN